MIEIKALLIIFSVIGSGFNSTPRLFQQNNVQMPSMETCENSARMIETALHPHVRMYSGQVTAHCIPVR